MVKETEAWHAAVHGIADLDTTEQLNNNSIAVVNKHIDCTFRYHRNSSSIWAFCKYQLGILSLLLQSSEHNFSTLKLWYKVTSTRCFYSFSYTCLIWFLRSIILHFSSPFWRTWSWNTKDQGERLPSLTENPLHFREDESCSVNMLFNAFQNWNIPKCIKSRITEKKRTTKMTQMSLAKQKPGTQNGPSGLGVTRFAV